MKKFLKIIVFFLLLSSTALIGEVSANSGDRIKGYAWSDTIGWISFNCYDYGHCGTSNYGVDVSLTSSNIEDVTGYAWSDNVGWISFDYCHNYDTCEGPTYDETTNKLSGDVMVLSGLLDPNDGWDGLIKLSDFSGTHPYGPVVNSGEFTNYSWGSDNIGWISYNCSDDNSCGTSNYAVTLDPFLFNFTADKGLTDNSPAPYHSDVLLSWQTIGNVSSCIPSNGAGTDWATANLPRGVGQPSQSTYLIHAIEADTNFTLTCNGAGGSIERNLMVYVKPDPPSVILGADDNNVGYNTKATLRWTTANVDSCSFTSGPVTTPPGNNTGSNLTTQTQNLTAPTNYFEIECVPSDTSEYPNNVTASTIVDVQKLIVDFYARKNPIPYNDKFELVWDTEFATGCTATSTPNLTGTGDGGLTEFAGNIVHADGEHNFVSNNQNTEGEKYTATLNCSGTNSQVFQKTLNLKVGKNPIFIEN